MLLRPYGLMVDGRLEFGLEVEIREGRITEIRPHTGIPEPFVLSPAFVNAHSHLEYRGLQGQLEGLAYGDWIREITRMKSAQAPNEVEADCHRAAYENRRTGVALIGEHSDRPYAAAALIAAGIAGTIFQEVITFFERKYPQEKLERIRANCEAQAKLWGGAVVPSPHAFHTVDRATLQDLVGAGGPLSIHVAETEAENLFTRYGTGPIADFHAAHGFEFAATGESVVGTLGELGYLRPGVQFVHCCAIEEHDIALIAARGVVVAHCPRSNASLRCPTAPVKRMLEQGIPLGLGLDSAASSGKIDMFDEMRACIRSSLQIGQPVSAEQTWQMATNASALPGTEAGPWRIEVGSVVPLIAIEVASAGSTEELIDLATPDSVRWVT